MPVQMKLGERPAHNMNFRQATYKKKIEIDLLFHPEGHCSKDVICHGRLPAITEF
jgi:hypothetical protein